MESSYHALVHLSQVSFAGDVDRFESFISKVALDFTDTVTRTASTYAQDDDVGSAPVASAADAAHDDAGDANAQLCSWASVNLDGFMADLRAVEGPSARSGARTVEMWSGCERPEREIVSSRSHVS